MALEEVRMSWINYLWRLLATGFSFTIFGIGGLFLTLLVFPLINLFSRDAKLRKQRARKVIHHSFRLFINMMSLFGMFDFDVYQDKHRLLSSGGKLVIANHPTLIDVVVLLAIMPHADCIVKQGLWNNPFLKGVVKAAGYIKNSQDTDELLEACKRSLNQGYSLIIFPEGTRTKAKGGMLLQRGASNIAIRCNADLVPVTICCHPLTLSKEESWYHIPRTKAHFLLRVEDTIEIERFQQPEMSLSIRARRLTEYLTEYFIGEQKRYARS
jgi:1-acyl-sn-glycerol-3-phosphate acyltransferase